MAKGPRNLITTLVAAGVAGAATVGLVLVVASPDDEARPEQVRAGSFGDETSVPPDPSITWELPATTTLPDLPPTSGPHMPPTADVTVADTTPAPPPAGLEDDAYLQALSAQCGVDIGGAQEVARRQATIEQLGIDVAALVGDDWVGAQIDPVDCTTMRITVATQHASELIEAQGPPDWVVLQVDPR